MKPLAKAALLALAVTLPASFALADDAKTVKTVNPGQLTVAYRTDDRPVSFIDPQGKPAGFLVEFCTAVADKLGLKVQYVATDFASMVPAVRNNRYDTAAFQTLVTPEREKVVDFTKAVGYSQARLVSRKDAAIDKVDGAKDKSVAITRGSALIPKLQDLAPGVEVREFPNIAASLNALLAKQVDGLFTGLTTATHLVEQHKELTASQMVTTGEAAFPVSKDNPELKAALDDAITGLMKDGTFTKMFVKWYPASVRIPDQLYSDYPGMPQQPAEK
ncbi:substrate-binding periplasmic protein [Rhizobium halophytocola]|uniref:Polar amino acid transport system substrate-binding protein n=1 Tax=Rhizobium halophytocola TaxID=735519 RepID=A0ABS4DUQ7_9HYPH|nr:transporter substrate-binding domain-containing protein [Rhizobium halophytocola]MBP1849422.1 polar amino acid transport system substrate-binding protein [Rhizobium halophytocola]